jgi:hypothetical protein
MRISILALFLSFGAQAATTQLNIALGTSVPADGTGQTYVQAKGPSRATGGEHIVIQFARPKTIAEIKLTAYSTGKAGKVLIHSATGVNGKTKVSLDGLFDFAKVTNGNPQNYKNLVMLTDTTFVSVTPQQAFQQIDIVAEGYTHNDASLLVQVISNDGLPAEEFLMSRTATGETLGAMIDEAKFAKFGINELQSLMGTAVSPAIEDLDGKTFTCSSYSRLDSVKLNVKTRTYSSPSPGVLQSHSDLQGPVQTWTAGALGVELKIDNSSGCGPFTTRNVVRLTGAGNLISEVVLDLENFLIQCESVGFDKQSVRDVETNSTYPSVLDPKMVADSYEFCRPTN